MSVRKIIAGMAAVLSLAAPAAMAGQYEFDDQIPIARFAKGLKFSDYPVAVYKGPRKLPRFSGDQRQYAFFETRIRNSVKEGPAFAGDMGVAYFGCGTDCTMGYITNVRTGRIYELPGGGDDNPDFRIDFRAGSRLMKTLWRKGYSDNPTCVQEFYEWTGTRFRRLRTRQARGPVS